MASLCLFPQITLVLSFRAEWGVLPYLGLFVRNPLLLLAGTAPAFCFSRFKKGLDKCAGSRSVNICRKQWSGKFPLTLLIQQLGVLGECKECGWQKCLAGMLFLNNIYSCCCHRLNPGLHGPQGVPAKHFLGCHVSLSLPRETLLPLPHFPSVQAAEWIEHELIWLSISTLTPNSEDTKVGFLQPSSRAAQLLNNSVPKNSIAMGLLNENIYVHVQTFKFY